MILLQMCTWTLDNSGRLNSEIKIEFIERFTVEPSSNCIWDEVRIERASTG